MKDELFPDAQQILDFYHLSEKVWSFGKLFFNGTKKKYVPWSENTCDLLRDSKYNDVLTDVLIKEKELKQTKDLLSTYIKNNINNIDYLNYQQRGYLIGSGAMESSNKTVLQYRLKQSGMRWNIPSAQAMVTLRAKMESNRWETDVVLPVKNFYNIRSL
jgi:hypothetical protein